MSTRSIALERGGNAGVAARRAVRPKERRREQDNGRGEGGRVRAFSLSSRSETIFALLLAAEQSVQCSRHLWESCHFWYLICLITLRPAP